MATAHEEALQAKLSEIEAIPTKEAKPPDMPMDIFSQEALYLYKWAQADKALFIARKFDWTLVEDLPVRELAATEAQSLWNNVRFGREEAMKKWIADSPAGYELRDDLLAEFRYAYHQYDGLKTRVDAVADGSGDADMIQDLNDLAVIGRENPTPLEATNFDFSLLDKAAEMSKTLSELRADASVDKKAYTKKKVLRDKAYTYLKDAVDEIRRGGQFFCRKKEDRLKGYKSQYKRRPKPPGTDDSTPPPDAAPSKSTDTPSVADAAAEKQDKK